MKSDLWRDVMSLQNKKVLLIVPRFYGYDELIQKALMGKCSKVYKIFENRDWVNVWHRFIYVYMPLKKEKMLYNFYVNQINKCDKDIDLVFVIRGSSLSQEIMGYMKKYFSSKCQYIMYQWDGIENNKSVMHIKDYFDKIFTFDINDSKKYGWIYRPLFYDKEMLVDIQKEIDITFLCSLHSQRVAVLKKLKEINRERNLSFFCHMYTNYFLFIKNKYFAKKTEYMDSRLSDIAFKPLSLKKTYEIFAKSRIVIDYTHPRQTGYTMRTIEALVNRCKIITNNRYIANVDFYNKNNIYLYDGINVDIPQNFINSEYQEISSDVLDYYSLNGWIKSILED